ncbi:MAG: hypothetical protein M3Q51_01830 [Pseudomonadota bacterium]|nr:hypothetical protein [Pseudomonadota bacterium]
MTMEQAPENARRQNRGMLIALAVLFFGGMLVAGLLRFSGWQPEGRKNKGEMLEPYADLRAHTPTLADGAPYRWDNEPRIWRILVAPASCDSTRRVACGELLQSLDTVWRLMGKNADRVHVLWLGALPADVDVPDHVRNLRADARLPGTLPRGLEASGKANGAAGDAAWLVDPNGFVVLRYAPGFDPGDLRADLARLLKVN